ncbi:MAG: UvrD-helicase domain-containing protein [Planctomycetaceae bacterium]|nr:UvrD-helicase domain-containing protein [Planctomycetaceae bacterium]
MTPPNDQDQRTLITSVLDENVFVEAAAGTGKTTCLVQRMVNLIASDRATVGGLAAVTFTRKAAAELRLRFSIALQLAADIARMGDDRAVTDRLDQAVADIDQAFVGTIHAFCGRLLRERPFDAGVDPEFTELTEAEDQALLHKVWREYVDDLVQSDDPVLEELESMGLRLAASLKRPEGLLTELEELGLEPAELGPAFLDAAAFRDVTQWPADPYPMPDWSADRRLVEEYVSHMATFEFPTERGRDELMSLYETVCRKAQHVDCEQLCELMELVDLFRKVEVVQKQWPSRAIGKQEKERFEEFLQTVTRPLQQHWRRHRYSVCLRVILPALEFYDQRRAEQNSLSFSDLLLRAAALLRDNEDVRHWCRRRFPRLLVDEFQDTDPVQAEVMLLLSADDPAETDWRTCRPVPGSLFVVGDPKQSIYRFRRADIQIFHQVRRIVCDHGGHLARLTTSFRSVPEILRFVNSAFGPLFPSEETDFSPSGVYHHPYRTDEVTPAVETLSVPGRFSQLVEENARQVAALIAGELHQQKKVPRTKTETDAGLPHYVVPADYLLVARYSTHFRAFERALRQAGVPCEVFGSGTMTDVPELHLLEQIVSAVSGPRSRIALLSVLRGACFGISDRQLYDYQSQGDIIRYQSPPPEWLPAADREQFEAAFGVLRQCENLLLRHSPSRALRLVAEECGLTAHAAAEDPTGVRLGSFLKAIDLCAQSTPAADSDDALARLQTLLAQAGQHDAVAARPASQRPVRLMTLHQCKGLESPIVLLIDPTGEKKRPVYRHVTRTAEAKGYLPVYGRRRSRFGQRRLLAEPARWDELEDTERRFLAAEHHRLLYVAVTRAACRLVVSLTEKPSAQNPWEPLRDYLAEARSPQIALPDETMTETMSEAVPKSRPGTGADHSSAGDRVAALQERWAQLTMPAFDLVAMKDHVLSENASKPRGQHRMGTEWGHAVHMVLDAVVRDSVTLNGTEQDGRTPPQTPAPGIGDASATTQLCRQALLHYGLPTEWLQDLVDTVARVVNSRFWQRALTGDMMSEVPIVVFNHEVSPPALMRGVLDLVVRTSEGTIIVDYKSERVTDPNDLAELATYYSPQLQMYARWWQKMTEDPVVEIGVFFTHAGEYQTVPLPDPETGASPGH